jgi:hydrogenase-1 operon protein HyaE
MTQPMPTVAGDDARSFPLIAQLFTKHGYTEVDRDNIGSFTGRPGHVMLLFTENPVRFKETLDLAVILPQIVNAFPGRFKVGVLLPEAARALQPRYGFARWPAFVVLKDGQYVGAVEGLYNWDEYLATVAKLLRAEPTRAPTIGIAVKVAGNTGAVCGN